MRIKVGNTTYRADMTMGAAYYLKERFDMEVDDVKGQTSDFLKYLWACVKSCAVADGTSFDEEFEQFISKLEPEAFNAWFLEFAKKNQAVQESINKSLKGDKKK